MTEKLKREGKNPYFITMGGSDKVGLWGYLEAVREIQMQFAAN